MSETKQYKGAEEKEDEVPPSPTEKLEDKKPLGSLVPGAENKESVEIKSEINPNTE